MSVRRLHTGSSTNPDGVIFTDPLSKTIANGSKIAGGTNQVSPTGARGHEHVQSEVAIQWHPALSIEERIELVGRTDCCQYDFSSFSQRLEQWMIPGANSGTFSVLDLFAERGCDRETFLKAMSANIKLSKAHKIPDWMQFWIEAELDSAETDSASDLSTTYGFGRSPATSLFHPQLRVVMDALRDYMRSLSLPAGLTIDEIQIVRSSAEWLIGQLSHMSIRTISLEVNCARLRGTLTGTGSEERYQNYLEQLAKSSSRRASLFNEYPGLLRFAVERIRQWLDYLRELLSRVCSDWNMLRGALLDPSRHVYELQSVSLGHGDPHCGGRSVAVLCFGEKALCVYKPRPLGGEVHFADLLNWFAQRSELSVRTPRIIDCKDYGWEEFITYEPCAEEAQVQLFYRRLGSLCALLYLIDASDVHHENIIASGEYPVIVDLEAIFSPDIKTIRGSEEKSQLERNHVSRLAFSGLLPNYTIDRRKRTISDRSGIGTLFEEPEAELSMTVENNVSDEIRFVEGTVPLRPAKNMPMLRNRLANPQHFSKQIIDGFEEAIKLIIQHKDSLLSESGVISAFRNDQARFLLRSTRRYARLQFDLYHPDMLRDTVSRLRLWSSLYSVPVPVYRELVWSEIDELQMQDIPYFYFTPSSKELCARTGIRVQDFLIQRPLDVVLEKIKKLETISIRPILWELETALCQSWNKMRHDHAIVPLADKWEVRARAQARSIANLLSTIVEAREGSVECYGYRIVADRWGLRAIGSGLYDGLAGIALFLAYSGYFLDIPEARHRSLEIAAFIQRHCDDIFHQRSSLGVGAFSGLAGFIYLLTHVGVLFDRPQMLADALLVAECVARDIESDVQFDIIGGAAGCIPPLIALRRDTGSARALQIAKACGKHLVTNARQNGLDFGWTRTGPELATAGFAHGNAGIAWALNLAAGDEPGYAEAAFRAIAAERVVLGKNIASGQDEKENSNYLTHQFGIDTNAVPDVWCWGAAGVGLSRLDMWKATGSESLHADALASAQIVLSQASGVNHSLCHGDLGNLVFLQLASSTTNDSLLQLKVYERIQAVVGSIDQYGPICGSINGMTIPGLMTGLAGIGYGLLWLTTPSKCPNVLLLEGPSATGSSVY